MNKPTITLFAASLRPELWMMQFYSLLSNKIPFEIIYVGHRRPHPHFRLPANVRFIESKACPGECCHIAIGEARGEYILHTCDDVIYSERSLDTLHEAIKNRERPTAVFPQGAFRTLDPKTGYVKRLITCSDDDSLYFGPQMRQVKDQGGFAPYKPPMGFMISQQLYYELGGFDKRLTHRQFGWDLCLRINEIEGDVEFCGDCTAEELRLDYRARGSILAYSLEEFAMFYSLWCKDNDKPSRYGPNNPLTINNWNEMNAFYKKSKQCNISFIKTRSDLVMPYEDDHSNALPQR